MGTKLVNGVEVPTTSEEDLEMAELAAKHLKDLEENEKVKYKQQRAMEYPSINDVVVAMIEKYEENRPEEMKAIMTKRIAIKQKYPKPNQ